MEGGGEEATTSFPFVLLRLSSHLAVLEGMDPGVAGVQRRASSVSFSAETAPSEQPWETLAKLAADISAQSHTSTQPLCHLGKSQSEESIRDTARWLRTNLRDKANVFMGERLASPKSRSSRKCNASLPVHSWVVGDHTHTHTTAHHPATSPLTGPWKPCCLELGNAFVSQGISPLGKEKPLFLGSEV